MTAKEKARVSGSLCDDRKIYCVGRREDFERLAAGPRKAGCDFIRCGNDFGAAGGPSDRYLLLDADPARIAHCIKNGLGNVCFYHNGVVLSGSDENCMADLERAYLNDREYGLLKELNLIRMFFDVTARRTVMNSLPVHIQLETTTFCNARCIMCDHYIAHNRGSRHLEASSVEKLSSILPYVSEIILHGNGEPLIHPRIVEIFGLYRKYEIPVSLNTNLSYLTDDILSSMKSGCSNIHVSCDGINAGQYESIRTGLSYARFLENLERLENACGDIERILEVVLMRQNIRNAAEFVGFAHDHGFRKVIFNALGCNEWIGNTADGLRNFRPLAYASCMRAREEGTRLGIAVVTPFDGVPEPLPEEPGESGDTALASGEYPAPGLSRILHEKYPWYTNTIAVEKLDPAGALADSGSPDIRGVCEHPFAKTYIDLSGNVSVCCPRSRLIVGTVSSDRTFEEIWNCETYQRIRETFYQRKLPVLCNDCYLIDNNSLSFMTADRG